MPRNKKVVLVDTTCPVYYAYYDKSTGNLISVTNEKSTVHDHSIEISKSEYVRLVTGVESFSSYCVGYSKNASGKTVLALVPVTEQGYSFRSNMFEWINETPTDDTALTVIWNSKDQLWEFILSEQCKNSTSSELVPKQLLFFVTLGTDFDFLIKTISLPTHDLLLATSIKIPFTTQLEKNIDKISVATKLLFDSYGLKIYDNN